MNIFITSNCPVESAQYLDTKRVIKMILETAQILSTSIIKTFPELIEIKDKEYFYKGQKIYRPYNPNMEVCKWARLSQENYTWVLIHFEELINQYNIRRGKVHKSSELLPIFTEFLFKFKSSKLTPFINYTKNQAQGVDFTQVYPTTLAYKMYLDVRWKNDKIPPKWT